MKKLLCVILSLVLLLSACSSAGGTASNSGAGAGGDGGAAAPKGKLNILYMSGVYADSARSMAADFQEKTGYEVEINDVPFASFHETAMLDFASQAGSYDVVAVNLSWLGEFAPHLEPLDAYVEQNKTDLGDFIPSVLDACRWDGALYGFPKAPTPNMMAYRTDLIETPPSTYAEYMELAAQHTDPQNGMYGISIPGSKEQYAVLYLVRSWAMGDGEVGREAMAQLGDVMQYCDPAALSWGLEESINAFLQGKAAFCEAWPTLGVIQKADDPEQSEIVGNWAIAPFPEEDTGVKQMSIWCVAVSKYSQNKEAAYAWLEEYASAERQTEFYEEFGVLPSRTSFWERDEIKNSAIGPLGEGLKACLPKWRVPVSAELDTIMANAVSSYMSGQMTLDEAMDFFAAELKKALRNNPPPAGSRNTNAIAIREALNG